MKGKILWVVPGKQRERSVPGAGFSPAAVPSNQGGEEEGGEPDSGEPSGCLSNACVSFPDSVDFIKVKADFAQFDRKKTGSTRGGQS